jgi:hypothetical protein
MSRTLKPAFLIALVLLTAACVNTQLVNVWSDPSARGTIKLTNVMALVIAREEVVRRVGEDQLVASLQPTRAVAAYRILSNEELKNKARAEQALKAIAVDGVVTMRLVGATEQPAWGSYAYPGFWGYYGHAYPMVYGPSYATTNTIVRLETKVYSLKDDRLIWGATSDTFNPATAQTLVAEVAQVVIGDLRKQGFVQ